MVQDHYDVVVVGAGNAAMAAALSAKQYCASVLVLEASGAEDQGGNTRYAAGQMRTVYQSVADMRRLVPDLTECEIASSDFGVYSREDYLEDVMRLTHHRAISISSKYSSTIVLIRWRGCVISASVFRSALAGKPQKSTDDLNFGAVCRLKFGAAGQDCWMHITKPHPLPELKSFVMHPQTNCGKSGDV